MPRAVVRTVEQCAVPGLITDMKELAEAGDGELAAKLRPLTRVRRVDRGTRVRRTAEADLDYADAAAQVVERAREVLVDWKRDCPARCESGRAKAFRFANRAMWQQRVRSVWIEARKAEPARQLAEWTSRRTAVGARFSWPSS